jgi:thiamine biosynthesis lipoprotein
VSERYASASFPALGTTATVVVRSPAALPAARAVLERELASVDRACSRFRPDSELTLLNRARGRPRPVSAYFLQALECAIAAAEATNGAVDPTLGRALRLSGYDGTFAAVRRRDGRFFVPSAARGGAWRRIDVDRERRLVRVPSEAELDLGATAKAFAADRAAKRSAAVTSTGVLVNLGGDIAVAGEAVDGGWPIGLADDHATAPSDGMAVVSIASGGLATSSTIVRRWATAAGDRHHVVDPRTGSSAETPWRTITAAAASCVDANTATTAALIFGAAAPAWLEQRQLPARLVANDGSVTAVGGWPREADG